MSCPGAGSGRQELPREHRRAAITNCRDKKNWYPRTLVPGLFLFIRTFQKPDRAMVSIALRRPPAPSPQTMIVFPQFQLIRPALRSGPAPAA